MSYAIVEAIAEQQDVRIDNTAQERIIREYTNFREQKMEDEYPEMKIKELMSMTEATPWPWTGSQYTREQIDNLRRQHAERIYTYNAEFTETLSRQQAQKKSEELDEYYKEARVRRLVEEER